MKCDGIRPICVQCRKRDQCCTWDAKPKMRGKGKKTIAAELARQQATAMAVAAAHNGGIVQVPMTPYVPDYSKMVGLGLRGMNEVREEEDGMIRYHQHQHQSTDFRSHHQNQNPNEGQFSTVLPKYDQGVIHHSGSSEVLMTRSRSRGHSDPGFLHVR
jgi:hypothetical protein